MADFKIRSIGCADSRLLSGNSHKFIIKGNGFKPGIVAVILGSNVTPAVTSSRFIDSGTLEIEIYFDERDANREHQINVINADGNQAFVRLRVGDLEVVKIGPQFNGNEPILELPPDMGLSDMDLDAVTGLLRRGTDVNAKDDGGMTLLHLAILFERMDIAELLIAEGADVNAKDKDGETPLYLADKQGHKDMVELLMKHGGK